MTIGIYSITHTPSNRIYYGSSKNIEKRFKGHIYGLTTKTHHNIILQRLWDKYPINEFNFNIEEECNVEDLLTIEDSYINSTKNINLAPANGGDIISSHPNKKEIINKIKKSLCLRYKLLTPKEKKEIYGRPGSLNGMYGKKHSDETKQKMSKNTLPRYGTDNHFYGKKHSDETKQKMSEHAKQRTGEKNPFYGKHHTDETKQKIRNSKIGNTWTSNATPEEIPYTKQYLITYPNSSTKTVFGLKAVASEFGVSIACIAKIIKDNRIPKRGKVKGIHIKQLS